MKVFVASSVRRLVNWTGKSIEALIELRYFNSHIKNAPETVARFSRDITLILKQLNSCQSSLLKLSKLRYNIDISHFQTAIEEFSKDVETWLKMAKLLRSESSKRELSWFEELLTRIEYNWVKDVHSIIDAHRNVLTCLVLGLNREIDSQAARRGDKTNKLMQEVKVDTKSSQQKVDTPDQWFTGRQHHRTCDRSSSAQSLERRRRKLQEDLEELQCRIFTTERRIFEAAGSRLKELDQIPCRPDGRQPPSVFKRSFDRLSEIEEMTPCSSLLSHWTSKRDRINRWLLHSLSSNFDVVELDRSMLEGNLDDKGWARAALIHEELDEASVPVLAGLVDSLEGVSLDSVSENDQCSLENNDGEESSGYTSATASTLTYRQRKEATNMPVEDRYFTSERPGSGQYPGAGAMYSSGQLPMSRERSFSGSTRPHAGQVSVLSQSLQQLHLPNNRGYSAAGQFNVFSQYPQQPHLPNNHGYSAAGQVSVRSQRLQQPHLPNNHGHAAGAGGRHVEMMHQTMPPHPLSQNPGMYATTRSLTVQQTPQLQFGTFMAHDFTFTADANLNLNARSLMTQQAAQRQFGTFLAHDFTSIADAYNLNLKARSLMTQKVPQRQFGNSMAHDFTFTADANLNRPQWN